MLSSEMIRPTFAITLTIIFLAVACGSRPASDPESVSPKTIAKGIQKNKGEAQSASLPSQKIDTSVRSAKPTKTPAPDSFAGKIPRENASDKIDWGREVTIEEIVAMAKSGKIQQIEWHVMPNIIRALSSEGQIFHIRNENKGMDIRNTLINAGVQIGKGGVGIRYMF